MSIKPPGNSLECQGGFHSSSPQTLVNRQILGSLFKCRCGFNRAGVGPVFLLFLPDDVDAVVCRVCFERPQLCRVWNGTLS